MIGLVVTFLPYVFIIYFLFRFSREPIYLLGIPFILLLRDSIFVNQAFIFGLPGSYDPDIRFLGWFIIVWLSISLKASFRIESNNQIAFNKQGLNNLDYIILALILISSIGLAQTLIEFHIIEDVYSQYFTLLSLFLGYFMIKDILRYCNLQVLSEFLYNIVIINSIASIFYILHQGLHINIYGDNSEYLSIDFQGELITRTFWFMPVLWLFSISYLLVFNKNKSIINIILLSINVLGVFISYTRSFMGISLLLFVLYYLLVGFKQNNFLNSIKKLVVTGLAGFVLFIAVSSFLPSSTNYFLNRFKELDENPVDAQSNNLVYRFYKTDRMVYRMDAGKILFGYGSVTEKQSPFAKVVHAAAADMGYAEVIFRWGYLGLALFIILFISSLVKSFFLFLRNDGIVSQFALLLLLIIVSQLIEGFTSWIFMSPNRFAMGLWYFGVLSALIEFVKEKKERSESIVY